MTTEGTMTIPRFQKNIFDTIGIKSLVWIDDFFRSDNDNNSDSKQENNCIETIHALCIHEEQEKLDKLKKLPIFKDSGLDFNAPWGTIEKKLKDSITSENIHKVIGILSNLDENFKLQSDLKPSSFNEMKTIFQTYLPEEKVCTFSLFQWQEKETLILNNEQNNDNTLFLVDLDFSEEKEGATQAGKDIIKKILPKLPQNSYCVLFSHEVELGSNEELTRENLLKELKDQNNQVNFSVISKKILKEDKVGIPYKVPSLLQRLYLRKINASLTQTLIENLTKSLADFSNDLSQRSIYELERVLFDSSEYEGISEFESLTRLVSIKQKEIINNLLQEKNASVVNKLAELRKLRQCGDSELKASDKAIATYHKNLKEIGVGSKFISLRYRELFNENVNLLHSPLACGDIFSLKNNNNEESKYILIAPSCDVIVRSNGTRKLSEVILIPIKERIINTAPKLTQEHSYIIYHNQSDKQKKGYFFDFPNAFSVNINFLDLCVYNSQGKIYLNISTLPKTPTIQYIKGWKIKYDQLCEQLQRRKNKEVIEEQATLLKDIRKQWSVFSLTLSSFEIINTPSKIGIKNFSRKKRLNYPYVHHLLQNYYAYKSRNSEEHDFTCLPNKIN